MRPKPWPFVNVFPAEQNKVPLQDQIDLFTREPLSDGSAMLMIDHAPGLVQDLPAALPGEKAEIGVLEIKRRE